MLPSDAALALLKEFEQGPRGGFAALPYFDAARHRTIGWGHKIQPDEAFPHPISAQHAERLLHADLSQTAEGVASGLRVPVTQAMFDALVCFAFNVGVGAFLGSTLRDRLNRGDYAAAAAEFARWNKARNPQTGRREPLSGLTRRRQAERELFLRERLPG